MTDLFIFADEFAKRLRDDGMERAASQISFNRYFYKPQPLRPLDAIRADILALETETEGLLARILGPAPGGGCSRLACISRGSVALLKADFIMDHFQAAYLRLPCDKDRSFAGTRQPRRGVSAPAHRVSRFHPRTHSPQWCELAYAAIRKVAERKIIIHVDDLISAGLPEPSHYNAWGAVWMRAIRDGVIQRSGETRSSKQPGKHAHLYPIYFSRVYRG